LLGLAALVRGELGPFLRALAGMVALYALYYLLMLIYPAGMGFGDVKLAGVVGLYLGWLGWAEVVIGGFLGFVIGALSGLGLMAARRATRKSALPFGPAMLLGALIAVLAGTAIADWYLGGMAG
jgi:leader peptidase (prepilin peptidase)/N-methyltransferase